MGDPPAINYIGLYDPLCSVASLTPEYLEYYGFDLQEALGSEYISKGRATVILYLPLCLILLLSIVYAVWWRGNTKTKTRRDGQTELGSATAPERAVEEVLVSVDAASSEDDSHEEECQQAVDKFRNPGRDENSRPWFYWMNVTVDKVVAPKTQRWWTLGSSAVVSAMGAWIIITPADIAYNAGLIALGGYAFANLWPFIVIANRGYAVSGALNGLSFVDWVLATFGWVPYIITVLCTTLFLVCILSAELTTAMEVLSWFVWNPATRLIWDQWIHGLEYRGMEVPYISWPDQFDLTFVPTTIAVICLAYVIVGGYRMSILTDCISFCCAMILLLVFIPFVLSSTPRIWYWVGPREFSHWSATKKWKVVRLGSEGFNCIICTVLGTMFNEVLNQTQWNRVWAARTERDLKVAQNMGGWLLFIVVGLMGSTGTYTALRMAQGKVGWGLTNMNGCWGWASTFWLMTNDREYRVMLQLLVACLTVILAASTTDSVISGLYTIGISMASKCHAPLMIVHVIIPLLIAPACYLSVQHISVLQFFMVTNIFACCLVPAVLLRFRYSYWATSFSVSVSFFLSILCVVSIGASHICGPDYAGYEECSFVGVLKQLSLPQGPYHWTTSLSFLVATLCSAICGVVISDVQNRYDFLMTNQRDRDEAAEDRIAALDAIRRLERDEYDKSHPQETGKSWYSGFVNNITKVFNVKHGGANSTELRQAARVISCDPEGQKFSSYSDSVTSTETSSVRISSSD